MNVIINGQARQLASSQSLNQIVENFTKHPHAVITELNGTIIPFEGRKEINLQEGDTLELVTFVGGG